MTIQPPPDPRDLDPEDFKAVVAMMQGVLIFMLVIAIIVIAPVLHPEWFGG